MVGNQGIKSWTGKARDTRVGRNTRRLKIAEEEVGEEDIRPCRWRSTTRCLCGEGRRRRRGRGGGSGGSRDLRGIISGCLGGGDSMDCYVGLGGSHCRRDFKPGAFLFIPRVA